MFEPNEEEKYALILTKNLDLGVNWGRALQAISLKLIRSLWK